MTLRVVLVAEEAAGVQALRVIAASGAALVAVLTREQAATTQRGVTVAALAQKLGCTMWPGEDVRSPGLAGRLRAEGVDLLINVHSLQRIDAQVIAAPALGSFNLHPGPLPQLAGLNAPSWAIYLGARQHAVTLHRMAAAIDTGPVAYESWFDLDEHATGVSVSATCVRLGIRLIERLLDDARRGAAAIPATPQDPSRRRLFRSRDVPHNGRVPWDAPAAELARWVRASDFHPLPSPWGCPLTRLGEVEVGLARAEVGATANVGCHQHPPGLVLDVDDHGVAVATGAGTLLLQTLVIDGKRVAAAELLAPGACLC